MDNYSQLVERIANSAKMESSEVERKVEAKRAKLSGLISKEGAAQIVAAELGIILDNEKLKIAEIVEGMKRARVVGKITTIFPIREYNKNGRSGKIGSFQLGDDSSNVRVVLWDVHHIAMIEEGKLKEGDVIELSNGNVRNGELHLSAFSDIKTSSEKLGDVKTSRSFSSGFIKDGKAGANLKVRAVVVQAFEPKIFDNKNGEKRALLNLVLDDGTETVRAVAGVEQLSKIGISFDDLTGEGWAAKKSNILGEEKLFLGNFRNNTYFNRVEMSISSIEEINADELIKELELHK